MRSLVLLAFASLLAAGCDDASSGKVQKAGTNAPASMETAAPPVVMPSGQLAEVKGAVMLYTRLLAAGYASLNMNVLTRAAASEQATKVYFHMAALGEAGVKMLSELKGIEFVSVGFDSPESVVARTEEKGHCAYYKIKTGEKVYENDVFYLLAYRLAKDANRWLVDEITIQKTEEGPGQGDLFFMTRPSGHATGAHPPPAKNKDRVKE